MKLSDFASEFDPSELPPIHGSPMSKAPLDAQIAGVEAAFRVEESLTNLLIRAVYSFYFAKRACPTLDAFADGQAGHLEKGIREVRDSLLRGAVIGVATTIDLTSGRTRSLPHALDALRTDLNNRRAQQADDEIDAALELLTYIRRQTNADEVNSPRYVRHLRNKWAGHSSLDLTVDGWAGADKGVDLRIVEDALVRLVNAFQDLSLLVLMSQDLTEIEAQAHRPQEQADGTVRIGMKVAWSGVNALAQALRHLAQQAADAFTEPYRKDSLTLTDTAG